MKINSNKPQDEQIFSFVFVLVIFTSFFPFIAHFVILLFYSSVFSSLIFSPLSGDSALGGWLNTQRKMHKGTSKAKRRLLPEREARLQALVDKGMLLWDPYQDMWEEKFNMLLKYGEEHGTCNVPQSKCIQTP